MKPILSGVIPMERMTKKRSVKTSASVVISVIRIARDSNQRTTNAARTLSLHVKRRTCPVASILIDAMKTVQDVSLLRGHDVFPK